MAQLSTKVKLYLESKGKTYDSESKNFYLIDNEVGKWEIDGVSKPTDSELDALESQADSEDATNEILKNRKNDYPSIPDQLDALYHAGVFPANMAARIKETKDKYPK